MRVLLTLSFEVEDDEVATAQARYDLRRSIREALNHHLHGLHTSKLRKVPPKQDDDWEGQR